MPVPVSIAALSTTPSSNSPAPTENVGPIMNQYFQAAFAFIATLYAGGIKPTAAFNMNSQVVNNVANGVAQTDAVNLGQLQALAYKVGEQRIWHGAVANIAAVWGHGWQLADGTNGTANLVDKFVVGAGNLYAPGATGGATSVLLNAAQMPVHNHTATNTPHTHTPIDNGHTHNYEDPSHAHTLSDPAINVVGLANGSAAVPIGGGGAEQTTNSDVNISILPNISGIGIEATTPTTTIGNAGGTTPVPTLPPYYASCIIEFTGF